MNDDELLTMTQAAERLGMHRTAVHKAVHQGRLPAQRVGSTWIVKLEDVEEYGRRPKHAGGRPRTVHADTRRHGAEIPGEQNQWLTEQGH